jgi:ADP-ribose pyrophosphatase YjhB (NUDIX family)
MSPDGKLLIVLQEHPRCRDWGYVGGGLEAGESLEDCAIRETREECGLEIRLGRLLCVDQFWRNGSMYGIGFVFLGHPVTWPQTVSLPERDESARFLDHRWIGRAEFDSLQGDAEYDFARLPWPEDVLEPVFRRTDA